MPVRLIWGMRDHVFQPTSSTSGESSSRTATPVELDDAPHYLVEDRPDEVAAAIGEFVSSL